MGWKDLVNRDFLVVALCGAGLAHFATQVVLLLRPSFPYWGIAGTIYAAVLLGYWLVVDRTKSERVQVVDTAEALQQRVASLSLIEAAREARRMVADETLFQQTPATPASPPLLEGIPESVRALLEYSEKIERIGGKLTIARESLALLPDRWLQLGRWRVSEGLDHSLRINLATGEAALWAHDEEMDREYEDLPSVYHAIVWAGESSLGS